MDDEQRSIELGREDAQRFIKNELIDYQPFIAISDMHLVRKTIPITYQALKKTLDKIDNDLLQELDARAADLAKKHASDFSFDGYAGGFAAGVAAVWEKIRDDVLKIRP